MKVSMKAMNPGEDSGGEDAPAWLTTYSDMMTDLLAIFVILFSFAMMAKPEVKSKAVDQMTTASSSVVVQENGGTAAEGQTQQSSPNEDKFNHLYNSINSYVTEAGLSGKLSVTKQGGSQILIRVSDSVLFDSGKAEITSQAEPLLDRISEILTENADFIKMVRIEGHTDNRPINTKQFDSNWELSTSRAVNVLRRLLETAPLGPDKFSAVGYGEFHPVVDNSNDVNRAKNRRVDFIIETAEQ